jgi:putative effector of murein hydrolase
LIVVAILLATGISFEDYAPAKRIMTFLLGPATVALALPLYKNRQVFFRNFFPVLCGLLAGSLGTMIAAGLTARTFGFTSELVASISIKSATVPIAVQIAKIIHGAPAPTAMFVVLTGMIGAAFGPWLMNRFHIAHPVSRGLALGTI